MAMSRAGRRRLILVFAVVVLGLLLTGGYTLKQAQTAQNMSRWLEEGTAAYERGDYAEALGLLSNYVARDKTNAKVLLDFADTRMHVPLDDDRHIAQARGIVQKALSIEPDSLRGRTMLMELYSAVGYWTEARDAAERILELDPTNLAAHKTRLQAFVLTNNSEEIIAAAMRMTEAVPDNLDIRRLAFGSILAAGADDAVLEDFLESSEAQFSGRLGLELMRVLYLWDQQNQSVAGTASWRSLNEQLKTTLLRASTLPAETIDEARFLILNLDQIGDIERETTDGTIERVSGNTLAQSTLDRFLENPDLASGLASFAAERKWSQGLFQEAGKTVLAHTLDLAQATDDTLGWLTLSGLPEADAALEILRTRKTPEAEAWLALADSARLLSQGDIRAAERAIPNLLPRSRVLETLALYLRGKTQIESGEITRASQTWRELLSLSPTWSIAQRALAEASLSLNRPVEAYELLAQARLTNSGADPLIIQALVAIDEQGLSRTGPDTRDSFEILSAVRKELPDDIRILCLTARAALATGHLPEAFQLIDDLLARHPAEASRDIAELAAKLDRHDPARAQALREALAFVATDPATILMLAMADAEQGYPERGTARLQEHRDKAVDDDKLEWDLALAHYHDLLGTPEAADRLLELSRQHPDNLRVQQHVLQAHSVWKKPSALGPVVQRLHELVGNSSSQWRLYNNKLALAMIDPQSENATKIATNIMFDLVSLTRNEPNNVEALDVFAQAAEIAGDTTRAAEYLLRAVRADPDSIPRRLKLINVALPRAGRLEEARQHAEALADLSLEGDTALLRERATTLERFGLNNLVRLDWERLAMAGDPTARVHMASILAASGKLDEAEAFIEAVLAEETLPDSALFDAANYLAAHGDSARGLTLLERLPDESALGRREQLIARYLFITTDTPKEAKSLEARAQATDTPTLWAAAVNAYLNLGLFEEAERVTSTALTLHPDAPDLIQIQPMFEAIKTDNPVAFLHLLRSRRGFTNTPESVRIVTLLDQRLSHEINDDQLIESLQKLVTQAPESFEPREALATAQRVAGRFEDMASTLRDALEAFPANVRVAQFAALQLRDVGATDQAISAARQWRSRLGRRNLEADQVLATMLLAQGRAQEALGVLEHWQTEIMTHRAAQPGDAFLLASALAGSGRNAPAMDLLFPLADDHRTGLDHCIRLTHSIRDQADQKQWLERLHPKVLEAEDPTLTGLYAEAWRAWASASGTPDDIRTATEIAESLVATPSGNHPLIHGSAALGRTALGEYEAAIPHYRAFLALEPDVYQMRNNLADILLKIEGNEVEALEHASSAVKLAQTAQVPPLSLRSYLDTQAKALLANGRPQEAVDVYQRLLEPDPAWPTGILGYAEALDAAGNPAQARKVLKMLDPTAMSSEQAAQVNAIRTRLED